MNRPLNIFIMSNRIYVAPQNQNSIKYIWLNVITIPKHNPFPAMFYKASLSYPLLITGIGIYRERLVEFMTVFLHALVFLKAKPPTLASVLCIQASETTSEMHAHEPLRRNHLPLLYFSCTHHSEKICLFFIKMTV